MSNCTKCRYEKVDKVCGPNGKTYINRCTAVYCAGVASVDLVEGGCAKNVSVEECKVKISGLITFLVLTAANNKIATFSSFYHSCRIPV